MLKRVIICFFYGLCFQSVWAQESDSTVHKPLIVFTPNDSLGMFQLNLKGKSLYEDTLSFKHKHAVRFAIIPGPVVDPLGNVGVAVLPVVVYRINPKDSISPPSSTSALVYFTNYGNYTYGLQQSLYLKEDNWRFRINGKLSQVNYDFYGVGLQPNDVEKISKPYSVLENSKSLFFEGYKRVYNRLYFGTQLGYENYTVTGNDARAEEYFDSLKIKVGEQIYTKIAPAVFWDSRDDIYWSTKGWYAFTSITSYINIKDTDEPHFLLNWYVNKYHDFTKSHRRKFILATRLSGQHSKGYIPFPDLAFYGLGLDLRGYRTGKYVNNSQFSFQTELRMDVWKYVNFAFFVGTGKSYKDMETFTDSGWLPAVGCGLYVKLIAKYNVRANGFVAVGKESWNWYMGLIQSF